MSTADANVEQPAFTKRPPAKRIASEEEAIRVAHELAAEFKKGAQARDHDAQQPIAELDAYSSSGLWAITVPKEYGGIGASYVTVARIFAIISAADSSLGQLPQNHFGYVNIIEANGSDAQKQELFSLVLQGARIGNAQSEKRNARNTSSRAHVGIFETLITRLDSQRSRVDGTKFYSTGALFADLIPVPATNNEGEVEIAFFDANTPGLKVINDWSSFGQRTTFSGTVELDGAVIPNRRILPGKIPDNLSPNGPISQLMQAAIDLGIGNAALEDTLTYVRERARPWIDSGVEKAVDDPLSLSLIGRLDTQRDAADALVERAARRIDEARKTPSEKALNEASVAIARSKIATTEYALEAAQRLFELGGTSSTLGEFGYDRHWRNARVHTLHDPVRWKFHLLGNYLLNGVPPKRHAWN